MSDLILRSLFASSIAWSAVGASAKDSASDMEAASPVLRLEGRGREQNKFPHAPQEEQTGGEVNLGCTNKLTLRRLQTPALAVLRVARIVARPSHRAAPQPTNIAARSARRWQRRGSGSWFTASQTVTHLLLSSTRLGFHDRELLFQEWG